jgi:hypothetical protein
MGTKRDGNRCARRQNGVYCYHHLGQAQQPVQPPVAVPIVPAIVEPIVPAVVVPIVPAVVAVVAVVAVPAVVEPVVVQAQEVEAGARMLEDAMERLIAHEAREVENLRQVALAAKQVHDRLASARDQLTQAILGYVEESDALAARYAAFLSLLES